MSTIIIYITKLGATEKNVAILKEKLTDKAINLCNLKNQKFDTLFVHQLQF